MADILQLLLLTTLAFLLFPCLALGLLPLAEFVKFLAELLCFLLLLAGGTLGFLGLGHLLLQGLLLGLGIGVVVLEQGLEQIVSHRPTLVLCLGLRIVAWRGRRGRTGNVLALRLAARQVVGLVLEWISRSLGGVGLRFAIALAFTLTIVKVLRRRTLAAIPHIAVGWRSGIVLGFAKFTGSSRPNLNRRASLGGFRDDTVVVVGVGLQHLDDVVRANLVAQTPRLLAEFSPVLCKVSGKVLVPESFDLLCRHLY